MSKKIVITALAALLALALCACSNSGNSNSSAATHDISSDVAANFEAPAKGSMGEMFEKFDSYAQWNYDDKEITYAGFDGEKYVVLKAKLEPDMKGSLDAASSVEEIQKIIRDLPVASTKEYTPPTQEEMDDVIASKGKDLKGAGYTIKEGSLTVNGDRTDAVAVKGDFEYAITFSGKAARESSKDAAAAVKDLDIKLVVIQGVSDEVLGKKVEAKDATASQEAVDPEEKDNETEE